MVRCTYGTKGWNQPYGEPSPIRPRLTGSRVARARRLVACTPCTTLVMSKGTKGTASPRRHSAPSEVNHRMHGLLDKLLLLRQASTGTQGRPAAATHHTGKRRQGGRWVGGIFGGVGSLEPRGSNFCSLFGWGGCGRRRGLGVWLGGGVVLYHVHLTLLTAGASAFWLWLFKLQIFIFS